MQFLTLFVPRFSFITQSALPAWWLLALLALLLLFLLYILFQIGESLGARWARSITDLLDARIREMLSGHARRYRQYIFFAHRNLDVKGLTTQGIYTLPLEQVFVELSLAPQPTHKTTNDPLHAVPENLRAGHRLIWDFLATPVLADQHFVIIGPPGSGKTTLLKHIALALVGPRHIRRSAGVSYQTPILIFLRDLVPLLSTDLSSSPNNSGLSAPILSRLRDLLSRCAPLSSEVALRSIFVDARLAPWANYVPAGSSSIAERVDNIIAWLYPLSSSEGKNALVLLLNVLTDLVPSGDALKRDLRLLARAIEPASFDPITNDLTPSITLIDAILHTFSRHNPDSELSTAWFARQLASGRCLIMFDGLDEVADPAVRQRIVTWVQHQLHIHANNRFIITSRPHGYRANPLVGVTVLEVVSLDLKKITRFVHNWYLANEIMSQQRDDEGVHLDARKGAEDLLHRIQGSPALSVLAVNPLLLTMIATVHRYRSSLPGRRVELYAEICEVFLGKRDAAKGLTDDLTPAQKRSLLQPLAFAMMCARQREIPREAALAAIADSLALVAPELSGLDFLRRIEASSGLLLEREDGVYSFAHLTFQEYLAAMHILEARLEIDPLARVADPWWHETLRLLAAQTDATSLIRACLGSSDSPSISALTLALACFEEARAVQPAVRAELETLLYTGIEDPDPERRKLVAEALLRLRLHRFLRLAEDTFIDSTLITHAEYQLFLDEMRAEEKYHQPDHWSGFTFPTGQGNTPIMGVRPSDAVAFCEWLTHRTPEFAGWRFRLPTLNEAQSIPLAVSYWCSTSAAGADLSVSVNTYLLSSAPHYNGKSDSKLATEHPCIGDLDHLITITASLERTLISISTSANEQIPSREKEFINAKSDWASCNADDYETYYSRFAASEHALIRTRVLANINNRILVSDLARDVALALDRAYIDRITIYAKVRTQARALIDDLERYHLDRPLAPARDLDSTLTRIFVVLKARIQGELPAFEGIRIVKERIK